MTIFARRALFALGLAMAHSGSSPAMAGELSSASSSGSFTFTVIIPPIGDALRLARGGAVGLWTIAGANDGLMIQFDQNSGGQALRLFRRPSMAATVSVDGRTIESTGGVPSIGEFGLAEDVYRVGESDSQLETVTIAGI